MKVQHCIGAALAAVLAGCGSGNSSAPEHPALLATSRAVPATLASISLPSVFARAAVARAGTPAPGGAPAFRLDGIEFLPLGIQAIDGADWYVQCVRYPDGHSGCAPVIATEHMRGLEVRTGIANDGVTPLTFFAQTILPSTPEEADRQSLMTDVFTRRYGEVVTSLRAGSSARARAPGTSKAKVGNDAEPDPGPHMQTIEIDGDRPVGDPEIPPAYEPPDPSAPPPPDGDGGGGGEAPEQPDGSQWKLLKPRGSNCAALPGPGGMPVVGCVVITGPRATPDPAMDPETAPLPPPSLPPQWDWCIQTGACGGTSPPPDQDPVATICASKFVVDASVCIRDRATGKTTRDKELQCLDTKYADLAKCRGSLGRLTIAPLQ
jgi:hypothetical protein